MDPWIAKDHPRIAIMPLDDDSEKNARWFSETARRAELALESKVNDGYKRAFDLAILVLAHLLLLPLWLILWGILPLAIWLTDRRPIFYTQVRVGLNGRLFRIVKFRTMHVGAERFTGPVWAAPDDTRITRIGYFLRRFRLDELPQVFNIWKGEMSLVGPRPERPELVEEFCRVNPNFRNRLRVRPGFAGLAQVRGNYATKPNDKLRYDELYIKKMGPWLDTKLLVLAVLKVLRPGPD